MDVLAPHQTLTIAFSQWGELTFTFVWLQLESLSLDVGLSSALLLSVGLVGSAILDRFFGGDKSDDDDDDALMGGDSLDGGDDGFGEFDDMGGMDDWDDPFGGDGDEGGESTDELDHRLGELEDEVARLSSTVSTVRSENTEISGTVDDIGENVRKLLDIYEMVTRGINPFVDDVQPGGGGGGDFGDGSFGLFDSTEDDTDDEELDDSIANADAEGFFDDALLDGDDGDFDDGFGDGFDDTEVTEEMETEIADDGGGKSFSELKDEYESGDADWADDDFGAAEEEFDTEDDETAEFDDEFDADDSDLGDLDEGDDELADLGEFGELEEADDTDGDDEFDLIGTDDSSEPEATVEPTEIAEPTETVETDELLFEQEGETDEQSETTGDAPEDGFDEHVDDPMSETATDEADTDTEFEFGDARDESSADGDEADDADSDGKPYLCALPDEYVGDLLVIEWMEFLVENADVADAARAIRYYERIEWVSSDVARTLEAFLVGFGRVNVAEAEHPGTSELTLSDHVQSLEYVQALAGDTGGFGGFGRFGGLGGFGGRGARGGRLGAHGADGRSASPAGRLDGHDPSLRHDGGHDGI